MTELLYQTDAYLQTFEAQVVAVDAEAGTVVLDKSAFYPGGGGQPNDVGTLITPAGELAVTKVKLDRGSGQVLHWVAGNLPAVGDTVTGQLDWDHRYQLMRTHTAMHILCGVVWRDYQAQVTGGNMTPLKGRMDFEFESLTRDLVGEIEEKINAEVAKALDTSVRILPREEAFQIPDLIRTKINLLPKGITEVRVVEIHGLDLQADGGTHVANTREVGEITISGYRSKGRINKRLQVALQAE